MSTPQDSTKPVTLTTSSPAVVGGKELSVRLSEEVSGFIGGMSPAGATVHDTGWVPITPSAGFAGMFRCRRIGRDVEVRWNCTTSIAAGAFINPICVVPDGFRPSSDTPAATYGAFGYPLVSSVGTGGSVYVRNTHTAALASHSGSAFYLVD